MSRRQVDPIDVFADPMKKLDSLLLPDVAPCTPSRLSDDIPGPHYAVVLKANIGKPHSNDRRDDTQGFKNAEYRIEAPPVGELPPCVLHTRYNISSTLSRMLRRDAGACQ